MAGLVLAGLTLVGSAAWAQSVVLAGRMGDKALLVVDGKPHTVAVGASAGGLRLLRWHDDEAEFERSRGGAPLRLRLGEAPATLGSGAAAAPAAREIVLHAGSGGHFIGGGSINGRPVQFMVDTGATLMAISQLDAARIGIDLNQAQAGTTQTANGPVPVRLVVLSSVRVGEVEVANVGAAILPQPMPYVLLGNSFLTRFQMRRDNDVMRLTAR